MRKKLRVLAVTVGAIGVVAALTAAPAMAEEVPAKASATNIRLSATSITVKKNGAEPKNCELASATGGIEFGAVAWIKSGITDYQTHLTCAGGTHFSIDFYGSFLYYDTATAQYKFRPEGTLSGEFESPWGSYLPTPGTKPTGVWTNGSGATNSTIKFNESPVGKIQPGGAQISFSGTFTAKTAAGGLITLSH
jgi:hypothetical protein